MALKYKRFSVDMDICVVALEEAYTKTRQEFGFEPDAVFVNAKDYPKAKEILDMLYDKCGIALNRVCCDFMNDNEWAVGKNSPLFTFGSPGA